VFIIAAQKVRAYVSRMSEIDCLQQLFIETRHYIILNLSNDRGFHLIPGLAERAAAITNVCVQCLCAVVHV